MKSYTRESEEVTIVVLGSFNPAIFQPDWFIRKGFIAAEELEGDAVDIAVIHQDISKFENEWFLIDVNPTRLAIKAKLASRIDSVRDLVLNIFSTLSETPIISFGVNLIATYKCTNTDAWHHVGDSVAPKSLWEKATGQPKRDIGMKQVEVRVERTDDYKGNYNIKISPSNSSPPKFIIHTNDHIEYKEMGNETSEFSSFLANYWDISLEYQNKIINNLVEEID